MRQHDFARTDWALGTIGDVLRALPPRKMITLEVDAPVSQAAALFKEHGISQIPVLDGGKLVGILTEFDVMGQLVVGRATGTTTVAEAMVRRVSTVGLRHSASELPGLFERGEVALVVDEERHLLGIVTKMDLIDLLTARAKPAPKH
jgi:cystathionine beta-synthase